jgi:replicative DNA helicase
MVSAAFPTGVKQTFRLTTKLGRSVRATGNHKFLTVDGWKRLDELTEDDCLAIPQNELSTSEARALELTEDRLFELHTGDTTATVSAPVVKSESDIQTTLQGDIYWDQIATITPDQAEEVYDLTVPGPHNFIADGIVVHNSIEQDADMVMFLYRPEYYKITEDEQGNSLAGVAEVIVGKNRHGEARDIRLRFDSDFARFSDLDDPDFDLLPSGAITGGQPQQPYGSGGTLPSKMNTDDDIPF